MLIKKIFLGLGFLFLITLGGAGTQSSSLLMQGMGFFGVIIGLIILYVFGRMVWKGIGCLPSFLILSAIVLFIMYSLGMFNNGLSGMGETIVKFIGYKPDKTISASHNKELSKENKAEKFTEDSKPQVSENFNDAVLFGPEPEDSHEEQRNIQQDTQEDTRKSAGFLSNIASSFSRKEAAEPQKAFNPNDYPVVYGSVRVVNADTLIMYNNYFRLLGIDAPESNQMCSDRKGRAYNCGREAALWLKNWIADAELECHVVQRDTKGNMIGTCSYGQYDIGAALVNAGWAVADTKYTQAYYPYELQAQEGRRGLWQGQFYKPWDWRKMQSRKPKIKIIRKTKKKNMFGI